MTRPSARKERPAAVGITLSAEDADALEAVLQDALQAAPGNMNAGQVDAVRRMIDTLATGSAREADPAIRVRITSAKHNLTGKMRYMWRAVDQNGKTVAVAPVPGFTSEQEARDAAWRALMSGDVGWEKAT